VRKLHGRNGKAAAVVVVIRTGSGQNVTKRHSLTVTENIYYTVEM